MDGSALDELEFGATKSSNIMKWRLSLIQACREAGVPYSVPKRGTALYKRAREIFDGHTGHKFVIKSGTKKSGKKKSGTKKSGTKKSGTKKSGKKRSGKKRSGKKTSGKKTSGRKSGGSGKKSGKKKSGKKKSGKKSGTKKSGTKKRSGGGGVGKTTVAWSDL